MRILGIDKQQLNSAYSVVDSFMKYEFPRIQRQSGAWLYSSPKFDNMPISPNNSNSSERRMINHSLANNAYHAIISAIDGCSKESQVIIKGRYLQGLTGNAIKARLSIAGNSVYYDKVKYACLELADCLEGVRSYYHVPIEVIPDLHNKHD